MRFHIGLSLNWKRLKKWLITILLGLLLYLGFNLMTVNAQVQNGDQLVRVTPDNWDYVNAGGLGTFNVSSGVAFVDFIVSFEDLSVEKGKTYHASFNFYGGLSDGFYSFDSQLWDFSSDNQPIQIYNLTMTGSGNYRNIDFDFYMPYDTKTFELRIYNNELPVLYYSWSGDSQFGCIGITLNKTNDNTDDLINQNDIIIGQNQQQIEEQEKTNEKLDELNENQKVCSFIDKKNISLNNKYLGSNGVVNDSTSGNGITDYISLSGSTIIVKSTTNRDHNYCFYDANKSVISCHYSDTLVLDSTLSIPKNASYVRFTINTNENKPTFEICKNGNQAITDSQEEIKDAITDSTVDKDSGNSFFDNFSTEDNGGISGIITAPLTLINSLLDNQGTCTDLEFPILGKDVAIPSGCMLWDEVPSEMETIIQMLVCGTGAYFILTQLFKDINDLKDPNKQGVSTLDL